MNNLTYMISIFFQHKSCWSTVSMSSFLQATQLCSALTSTCSGLRQAFLCRAGLLLSQALGRSMPVSSQQALPTASQQTLTEQPHPASVTISGGSSIPWNVATRWPGLVSLSPSAAKKCLSSPTSSPDADRNHSMRSKTCPREILLVLRPLVARRLPPTNSWRHN